MIIQSMTRADFEAFWPVFESVIQAQETYAFDPGLSMDEAFDLWCELPLRTFVAKQGEVILGSYYLKPNAGGPGGHVCNCGYMVAPAARGKGVAKQLCQHSQQQAIELGFKAMQFNAVVSTNEVAVKLWQSLGFEIVGTLPKAYAHKRLGLVDSFVMYKWLLEDS
ncbi:GNAT family N-acetyltransferase [Pleionea sp. CnH1-48]|uniref:GNAT family N-acetyltransferase n=1 Tax=Pleionea sp. CnH1-48 TaxID=2954494 RepID=UPI0020974A02|nr:GNAT family N-acetyltransferase [Pleionea sp. CnH1-48]MCO7223888.1 GNAT family N-acetyltransferase [Pleionea sp. CnH1-48]